MVQTIYFIQLSSLSYPEFTYIIAKMVLQTPQLQYRKATINCKTYQSLRRLHWNYFYKQMTWVLAGSRGVSGTLQGKTNVL